MRTGIIHLLGFAATLLLLLTIIAWVDSGTHGVRIEAGSPLVSGHVGYTYRGIHGAAEGCDATCPWRFEVGRWEHGINSVDATVIDEMLGPRFKFRIERSLFTSLPRITWTIPPWIAALPTGVIACIYLRFLLRRRRAARAPGVALD